MVRILLENRKLNVGIENVGFGNGGFGNVGIKSVKVGWTGRGSDGDGRMFVISRSREFLALA